ncbi:hypothetical protein X560_1929 [Listeria fleischmannii 1991]|uniref:Uncharacterized protein n=1 Tax=Listeria fleischmannii 1991 TaxID=1430899 RepID=A0A0J8GD55_9LIST|nr:hypothetical protein X560_1929 [Listeria fleischmannii 1991]
MSTGTEALTTKIAVCQQSESSRNGYFFYKYLLKNEQNHV